MYRVRVFRYLPEIDAFEVTPEYAELAELLGLAEWNPVVWIGRLFLLDNDFGEHWFDNWEARASRSVAAERLGLDADSLLVLDAQRFANGDDGPCNTAEIRLRFWRDVLTSLELSTALLFAKARDRDARLRAQAAADPELRSELVEDLEERIESWVGAHPEGAPVGPD